MMKNPVHPGQIVKHDCIEALGLTVTDAASALGVIDSGIPLLLSSDGVSPPPSHFPVPVKMPVSNLDCETSLHPLF